jgi:hypothetical protein
MFTVEPRKEYWHKRTRQKYYVLLLGLMKIGEEWTDAVIYTRADDMSSPVFVRERAKFLVNFEPAE